MPRHPRIPLRALGELPLQGRQGRAGRLHRGPAYASGPCGSWAG